MIEELAVGFIRGPHGIAGEFKVESTSGEYDHIAVLEEVTLRHGSDRKICKVESAEAGNSTLYMKVAGIESPEDVRKYIGWEIVVPRDKAAPLNKDEWYIEDLKQCSLLYENKTEVNGLAAEAAPAEKVGTITDVLEGGAGYLLEVSLSESCSLLAEDIKKTASGKARTVLVPFNKDFIGKVDVKDRTVQLMHLWILE